MPQDIPGVINEFKSGTLHSGSSNGPVVKNKKQSIAIALAEQAKQKGAVPAPARRGPRKFRRTNLTRVPHNAFGQDEE